MDILQKYGYKPSEEAVKAGLEKLSGGLGTLGSEAVYKTCFSFMDLTTLKPDDTPASVSALVGKVTRLSKEYPSYPLPASICVYPNFAPVVKAERCSDELHVTTVASCFPSTQSFLEVKVRECEMAVAAGADEIDIVLSLCSFLSGDYEEASLQIRTMKAAIDAAAAKEGRKVVLKVILETGLLKTYENIARASFIAMEAGADFIKTSTGKVEVNATPEAAWVMCECIREYFKATGRKVGFKAAGGISTADDAVLYYSIGKTILGPEWMNKDLFRFGVSRVGNSLMSAIEGEKVVFF